MASRLEVVIWVVVRGLHVEEGGLHVVIQGGGAWSTCGGKGGKEMGWTAGANPLLTIPTHRATSATTSTSGPQDLPIVLLVLVLLQLVLLQLVLLLI